MADAKHKGELLAGEAGVILGPPMKIEEQEGSEPGPRHFKAGFTFAAPSAPAMAVAPGEEELTVTVSVIYELKLPK